MKTGESGKVPGARSANKNGLIIEKKKKDCKLYHQDLQLVYINRNLVPMILMIPSATVQ